MKNKKRSVLLSLLVAACLLLGACFGVKADTVVRGDGSGTIAIEYRVSEYFLTLGAQEGNEAAPALPVGKQDFQDAADEIDGLKLTGYSRKKDGEDVLYSITLEFTRFGALAEFMSSQDAGYFDYTEKDGRRVVTIVFAPDAARLDDGAEEMLPVIFEGYTYDFKISFPSNCDVRFFNGGAQRTETFPVGTVTSGPRSFEFSSPMSDIVTIQESAGIEIRW
jgi:hypothetical protein